MWSRRFHWHAITWKSWELADTPYAIDVTKEIGLLCLVDGESVMHVLSLAQESRNTKMNALWCLQAGSISAIGATDEEKNLKRGGCRIICVCISDFAFYWRISGPCRRQSCNEKNCLSWPGGAWRLLYEARTDAACDCAASSLAIIVQP